MRKLILCLIIFTLFSHSYACALDDKWNITKSTHFIVYYKDNLQDFADKVIEKAEELYEDIAEYLGFRRYDFWLWENRAEIYIYKDLEEYRAATGQPAWSSGCVSAKEKIIKTFPKALGFLDTVLPHEMAHIIFREFVGFDNPGVPLWLDEGIAGYQEKARRYNAKRILKSAMINNKFIGLEKLHMSNLHANNDSELVEIFYAEAISIVDYLIKEFGQDIFFSFCRALRDKKTLDKALNSVYPFKNLKELDNAWQIYLKK